jgi:hypothetical protein
VLGDVSIFIVGKDEYDELAVSEIILRLNTIQLVRVRLWATSFSLRLAN